MPRLDGTGPEGKGSGTGRAQGFCQQNQKEYSQTMSKVNKVQMPTKKDKATVAKSSAAKAAPAKKVVAKAPVAKKPIAKKK